MKKLAAFSSIFFSSVLLAAGAANAEGSPEFEQFSIPGENGEMRLSCMAGKRFGLISFTAPEIPDGSTISVTIAGETRDVSLGIRDITSSRKDEFDWIVGRALAGETIAIAAGETFSDKYETTDLPEGAAACDYP